MNKFTRDTKDQTSLEIRFPPTIKMYKEIEIYALFNMLAGSFFISCLCNIVDHFLSELGGYLGMFLGVSFFDLKMLVDLIKIKKNNKYIRRF